MELHTILIVMNVLMVLIFLVFKNLKISIYLILYYIKNILIYVSFPIKIEQYEYIYIYIYMNKFLKQKYK